MMPVRSFSDVSDHLTAWTTLFHFSFKLSSISANAFFRDFDFEVERILQPTIAIRNIQGNKRKY
jgi:hypothetical protein